MRTDGTDILKMETERSGLPETKADMSEVLERLLHAYSGYYDIRRESALPQFAAEAVFSLHDEQYFLVKAARISEADSKEIIFFALTQDLDGAEAEALCTAAWEEGLSRVCPGPNHHSTDIGLVILAQHMHEDAADAIRRFGRFKSYRFGLRGFSRFRSVAYDLEKHVIVRNKMGDTLEKVISDIFFKELSGKKPSR